jgi:N-hydroxyarylamine O-acetyltransferase
MSMQLSVDNYLRRIGASVTRTATLETLRKLVLAHTQSIPFENLNPLMGQPVSLSDAALEEKIIAGGRGGYCFEQNLVFSNVLEQLGFSVTRLAARVMWNAPATLIMPRSHMLLLVDIDDESHVVDVGFGGLTLTGVLRLEPGVEQRTPHEPFRLVCVDGEFVMQAHVRGEWRPLYRFDLQSQAAIDYEPVNWYLSTHPESRFVKNLIAARSMPDRRYALFNREMATHYLGGETQRRTLTSIGELRSVLEGEFLVRVPESRELDQALAKVLKSE